MHQSIATIESPEFINLQPMDISPLMSSCEIKVLYLGENRNRSYITKDVANEMAKTLRGAPIVGYFREDAEDFGDHGQEVIIDEDGVKFKCKTKPYGFVSPDAKVWFQKFEETDDFGNKVEREYLMTTGYLWTEQYEECKSVITNGKNQSMELEEETLEGHWATNNKTGIDFFIINDARFSKLCILGDDVEPCFEGARVTAPDVSTSFTKMDDGFRNTLYTMMQELQTALKGGQTEMIENENNNVAVEEEKVEDIVLNEEEKIEENLNEEDKTEQPAIDENQDLVEEENQEEPITEEEVKENEEESTEVPVVETEENVEEEVIEENNEEVIENNNVSIEEYNLLQEKCNKLELENAELLNFKKQIEDEKKDRLIGSFYMLSDEDKKEVIDNKSNYSLEEIESKLSVICFRKKVNFNLNEEETSENNKEEEVSTYDLNAVSTEDSVPAWINQVKKIRDSRK